MPSTKLRRELLKETHDTRWAGHPGEERTLALLARSFHWPKMKEDVQAYVKTCHVCQVDKTERKKEAGLLQPLPIPEKPWQCVSMDFITGFPKVESFGSVLVVVDRFSKYAVFIPAPSECPAEEAARIFFSNVVKHFGMPEDIMSDRDSRFTGRFWVELFTTRTGRCASSYESFSKYQDIANTKQILQGIKISSMENKDFTLLSFHKLFLGVDKKKGEHGGKIKIFISA